MMGDPERLPMVLMGDSDTDGSLTIRNVRCEHTGHYKLQISCSSKETYYKTFKGITDGEFHI